MERIIHFAGLRVVSGPDWPGVEYFSSTRQGGVSAGSWNSLNLGYHTGDDPAHVAENRRRLTDSMPGPVAWVRQVHGINVLDVDGFCPDYACTGQAQADALITASRDRALAIMTADCLPVVLGSSDGSVIGIAHAGWRGLAGGVLENTLSALKKKHAGGGAVQWRAWIGPGISQANFEVGDEVRQAFADTDSSVTSFFTASTSRGKWLADLPAIARHRLRVAGVTQIDVSSLCTYDRSDLFYSYRRQQQTGRFATFVWQTAHV